MNPNKIMVGVMAILFMGIVSVFLFGDEKNAKIFHGITHKAGLCPGESCHSDNAAAAQTASCGYHATNCSGSGSATQTVAKNDLTPEEEKVVNYIADQIEDKNRIEFEDGEIETATGVSIYNLNQSRLKAAVISELSRRNINLNTIVCAGNCTRFSACSVDRNLNGASGEELVRYEMEKAEDGKTYGDFAAPEFRLPTITGKKVSLEDYRGKPLALVLMSVHCYHSIETLPILTALQKKYEARGLLILSVFVNATSVEDIRTTVSDFDLNFPVAVAIGKAFSESLSSRMVPTTFLIDGNGNITKKLVGYKDQAVLERAFSELIEPSSQAIGMLTN